MDKIRCLIIDDEPASQNVLKSFISKIDYLEVKQICNDALEALDYLKSNGIDLLFLDINMPQLSGVSFYKSLKKPPKVIFTTAYSEYALEGFELEATDYLLKPFSFERFVKAISKVKSLNDETKEYIIIKADKKLHQLKISDIYYIESLRDYIKIHLKDSFLVTYNTLKNFYESLPDKSFLQIHKSFIINFTKVNYIQGNFVVIKDQKIPIGPKFKQDLFDKLNA